MKKPTQIVKNLDHEPIAIISMACRFPGGINNPEMFWQFLKEGKDAIIEVPKDRWNIENQPESEGPNAQVNKTNFYGGFLTDVDKFDAQFFHINSQEAEMLDPQHRLLLEVTYEAFERANVALPSLNGSQTGVFIGISTHNYENLLLQNNLNSNVYANIGNIASAAAGHISYFFGLRGPSAAIDTASSSSLVAIHNACMELKNKNCHLAVAGGVNLILSPEIHLAFSEANMLAPDGHCKVFDESANGYVRSEGCGIVILKRLSDAQKDGENILAVIKSSSTNQDGQSNGFTAPNSEAQVELITKSLELANLKPEDIDYFEAHGTGTPLGDKTEGTTLAKVFHKKKNKKNPLIVGSVKGNIGHLEAAAGVAGLIKTVLALQHKEVPANLHFNKLNPEISFESIPALVQTKTSPWPQGNNVKRAAVNSFGITGTNANLILEESQNKISFQENKSLIKKQSYILCLSGKNKGAIKDLANKYIEFLNSDIDLGDVCYTTQVARTHFEQRLAVVGKSKEQIISRLQDWNGGKDPAGVIQDKVTTNKKAKKAFLFTGGGAQYIGMGKGLYETIPIFKKIIDQCAEILKAYWKIPLLSILWGEQSKLLDRMDYMQPALFVLEFALYEVWKSWGITPDAVIGHSLGEYVAATVAEVFSLEDGLKLIVKRAQLMHEAPGDGAMASIATSEEDIAKIIENYSEHVSIGALNGPKSTMISGDKKAVLKVLSHFENEGVKIKLLPISNASHSPLMNPILTEFEKFAEQIEFKPPKVNLISNVTGKIIQEKLCKASYWSQHIRNTVRFADGITSLYELGCSHFIEIGPDPILLGMAQSCIPQNANTEVQFLPSLKKESDDLNTLFESLATLYAQDVAIHWNGVHQDHTREKVLLPSYQFQRKSYWFAENKTTNFYYTKKLTEEFNQIELDEEQNEFIEKLVIQSSSTKRKELVSLFLQEEVRKVINLDSSINIDTKSGFMSIGLDSFIAVKFRNQLTKKLGEFFSKALPANLTFSYPNIDSLAEYLLTDVLNLEKRKITPLKKASRKDEPIAIIGMACRFPGGATNVEEFWNNLSLGKDAITEIPKERFDIDLYYDANPDAPRKTYARGGGFITDVDAFDASFFNISPREALALDPQQRILLEVSYEALENSGYSSRQLFGSQTGIFLGIMNGDYKYILEHSNQKEDLESHITTGNLISTAAGRLSYTYGFQGPAMSIDTACSSSLVAVHLACESLKNGSSNLALAAGVNIIATPEGHISFSKIRALSPDSHCKTFDENANGYARGEGCGVIILKRLSDAIEDKDNILATIQGSAVNQDGRSSSLTAPNGMAQEALIREALSTAQVKPSEISYVEAHGTGTPLGDPIEIQSLGKVLKEGRNKDQILTISSVKTNIGHLEGAAGIAGLIKTVLCLQRKKIPPHLNFKKLNPNITLEDIPAQIPLQLMDWNVTNKKRIAGVSSFGISGTNAHIILEEFSVKQQTQVLENRKPNYELLTLSAHSVESLRLLTSRYKDYITKNPDIKLEDICYSLRKIRNQFQYRASFVAANRENLLQDLSEPEIYFAKFENKKPKIVFLFTGQGSQYIGMGKALYEISLIFKKRIDECEKILSQLDIDIPLTKLLFDESSKDLINQTKYTQISLFCIEYALAKYWESLGVIPDYLIGHSVGEYVAAVIAEVLSLEDGLKLATIRGELMQSLPTGGAMVAVDASFVKVQEVLSHYQGEGKAEISGINSEEQTVISGDEHVVKSLVEQFKAQKINCKKLMVSHAFHSHLVDPILKEYQEQANKFSYKQPSIPIISNLTGKVLDIKQTEFPAYFASHMRSPVLFKKGIDTLKELGCEVFIEVGPQPVLINFIHTNSFVLLPSLQRKKEDQKVLIESIGKLYCSGYNFDWERFDERFKPYLNKVTLPTYAFDHKKYWVKADKNLTHTKNQIHPLLGLKTESALRDGEITFESELSVNQIPYLQDHQILNNIILPGAAYLEMAIAAASHTLENHSFILENIVIENPLVLENEAKKIQIILEKNDNDNFTFHILSKEKKWVKHTYGQIVQKTEPINVPTLKSLQEKNVKEVSLTNFYSHYEENGIDYGPCFRGIQKIWRSGNELLAKIQLPEELEKNSKSYLLHPALLDACFQTVGEFFHNEKVTYLPFEFEKVVYQLPAGTSVFVHATLMPTLDDKTKKINLCLYDETENIVAVLSGFTVVKVSSADFLSKINFNHHDNISDLFYKIQWKEKNLTLNDGQRQNKVWLIYGASLNVKNNVSKKIELYGDKAYYIANARELEKLIEEKIKFDRIIHLSCLNIKPFAFETEEEQKQIYETSLLLTQATIKEKLLNPNGRLCFVTYNAQAVLEEQEEFSLSNSPIWGLAKTIAIENPELRCLRIDLAENTQTDLEKLWQELNANDEEDQVAYRRQVRYVARLEKKKEIKELSPYNEFVTLDFSSRGIIDNLEFKPYRNQELADHEIEIQVYATGLNFRDVLNVMGLYPGQPGKLGIECSGKITRLGKKVEGFKIGDDVIAQEQGCLSSYVKIPSSFVAHKAKQLSYEEAATIPAVFSTVHYAFNHLAKLSSKDKVLIHSASGGVGLAAIQIAKNAGAEIFATAGTSEKRELLKSLGVKHIMDSRNLDFAEQIMEITKGEGIDVVLNSLTGEFIPKSLSVLKNGGCFLEIGKRDIWTHEQVNKLNNGVNYFIIALDQLGIDNPGLVNLLLNEIMQEIETGKLKPLPITLYPIHKVKEAFRFMAQGKHTGKIILSWDKQFAPKATQISQEGCYLITGGLGGLGLKVAEWLVEKNVKHLVLAGRKAPSDEILSLITRWQEQGVNVQTAQTDIANYSDVNALIKKFKTQIKGIIHAAGVLEDALLLQQDFEKYKKVMSPKILGAWNLQKSLEETKVTPDFFVSFSSIASMFGNIGQANYAAANAFLDSFAFYQRKKGINALCINWGAWSEVGMAAHISQSAKEQLAAKGMLTITPNKGLKALEKLLLTSAQDTQVEIIAIDWNRYLDDLRIPFYSQLVPKIKNSVKKKATSEQNEFIQKLKGASSEERRLLVIHFLQEIVQKILGFDTSIKIDTKAGFMSMGMDSLMAVEFKNRLTKSLGEVFNQSLPATLMFNYPNIEVLSDFLLTDILFLSEKTEKKKDEEKPYESEIILKEVEVDSMSLDDMEKFIEG